MGQRTKRRKVGQHRKRATGEHHGLAPDPIRQRAEHDEKRRREGQRHDHHDRYCLGVELQHFFEEEERIKLPAVPHDGLACRRADQREQHEPQVLAVAEGLGKRRFR